LFRFYVRMASKNLFRHKRRAILTALAIAVGIWFYIYMDSFISGTNRDGINGIIDFETGHLQVASVARETKDDENHNLKHLLPDPESLRKGIAALPEVKAVTGRLYFAAAVLNGIDELPVIGAGVDPAGDGQVFLVDRYVKPGGRWLRPGAAEAVLGYKIAELLELQVGDQITVRTQTRQLSFQAVDLTVVGIVASPDTAVNQNQMFIPLDTAQHDLEAGNSVTKLFIRLNSPEVLKDAVQRLKSWEAGDNQGPRLKVESWQEAAEGYLAMLESKRGSGLVILLLILVISTIGIINTILLSSLERIREIGILKALGMTEREIVRMFVFEGLGLGLLGGLIGAALGIVTNLYIVNVGIDITAMYGDADIGMPISGVLRGEWNWLTIFGSMAYALVVAWLASFWPARKAARTDPVEGLRRA
jgi:putative ABC transport system permease protein